NGLFAFYAAINGAEKVIVMEPEFDGSTAGIQKQFEQLKSLLGNLENVEFSNRTLQNYTALNKFDVVLLHNSINHLDEDSCQRLHYDIEAQKKYLAIFEIICEICVPGAELIITDCSSQNFFAHIGVTNPFAKS